MRRFDGRAKFAALVVLIFVNSTLVLRAQDDSIYRLPAGTKISLRMDAEINSRVASVNDTFLAYVTKPVKRRDVIVVPEEAIVEGRVTKVTPASGGSESGRIEVVFESLKFAGSTRQIDGVATKPFRAVSSNTFSIFSILGGAAAGALVGAASSPRGALIGAGIGAGAGTGAALLRKGKDVRIRRGEEFDIELKKDVTLPVLDY